MFIIFQNGKRGKARLMYHTSLSKLFGVEKYSDSLWKICKTRGIEVTLNSNLIGIEPDRKIAYFENLDSSTYTETPVPVTINNNNNKRLLLTFTNNNNLFISIRFYT